MSGIRIANAMNPTAPPMTTMMMGSSRLVIACTRTSTCASYESDTDESICSS